MNIWILNFKELSTPFSCQVQIICNIKVMGLFSDFQMELCKQSKGQLQQFEIQNTQSAI